MAENKTLQFDDSVKFNKKGEAILGKLQGPVADIVNPTRNGRKYSEELWEKVFEDEIVNEYFNAGGLLGELNHPADRTETDLEKVAVCMPEKPTRDKDGHLIATFDILDTPNGRIVATLAKYGYQLGISSRGSGDIIEDFNGNEEVNPDSYKLEAWDIVLLPAVKAARLKMVESLQNGKTLKQAINEQLEKATPDEKKVMQESLRDLNIEYTSEKSIDTKEPNTAAIDNGATMVKELQESLLAQQKLETQITDLQEKLSVCYAKEAKYEEDLVKYKNTIVNLSDQVKQVKVLKTKVESLTEDVSKKDLQLKEEREKSNRILNKQKLGIERQSSLTESLSAKNRELIEANSQIRSLTEKLNQIKKSNLEERHQLEENLADMKKNLTIKTTEYSTKLSNSNKLIEQYRNTAKTAVNKYIESKAIMIGVNKDEILNKLPNNYSFNDIDRICENLAEFSLKVSNLSFDLGKVKRASITESKDNSIIKSNEDDIIDDSLLRLADNIKR